MKKKLLSMILALGLLSPSAFAQVVTAPLGTTGLQAVADGQPARMRTERSGALVTTEGHGRYEEATYRSKVFKLAQTALTVTGPMVSSVVFGSLTFIDGFFNPTNSGNAAVILDVKTATTSGTPGGPLLWSYTCGVTLNNTATGTIRSGILSATAGASAMTAESNVVLTGSPALSGSATTYGIVGGQSTTAVGAGNYSIQEDIAGKIIVPPGCIFGITATGTGTSHVVGADITWEEIAYP